MSQMNKSPLKSITVQWYEGFQFRDTPFTVYTWKELDDFLLRVYDERVKEVGESNIHIGGYSKVKVRIEWKNGDYLEDRIDVGGTIGDYASRRDSPIGDYLKGPGVGGKPRSAMYGSSFQYDTDDGTTTGIVTETSRDDVVWNDDEGVMKTEKALNDVLDDIDGMIAEAEDGHFSLDDLRDLRADLHGSMSRLRES